MSSGLNIGGMSFIPLNTHQGLLGMGEHLGQTANYLQAQPVQVYRMPESPTPPTFQYMDDQGGIQSFNNVMLNAASNLNETTQKPQELMQIALSGGPVDIQDVMMATTKAELAISLTSQMLTKAIQAYEKLSQIQV